MLTSNIPSTSLPPLPPSVGKRSDEVLAVGCDDGMCGVADGLLDDMMWYWYWYCCIVGVLLLLTTGTCV